MVRDDEHPLSDRDFLAERREALRALERVVEHDDLPDHVRSAFKAQRSLLELYAPDVPGFKDGELDPFEGARLIERTLRETAARLPAEPRDRELRGLMLRSAGRWELIADTAPVNLTGGGA